MSNMDGNAESGHGSPRADAVLEMVGTAHSPSTCALLTPAIKAKLQGLAAGQVLEVRVDDPTAATDIAAWCRLTGHELVLAVTGEGQLARFYLRKKRG
jgi:tRNA 2-thiouridine synthesizing protein A